MNLESNKRIANELFARFTASDIPGALALLSDDLTWVITGRPGLSPAPGQYDKINIEAIFRDLYGRLKGGLTMTVKSVTAEADRVALEVESHAELSNGRVYNNAYFFLLTLRDEKIVGVREYQDSLHAYTVFFA
jgi:uncharacterized protein